jgi:hypothetical protein
VNGGLTAGEEYSIGSHSPSGNGIQLIDALDGKVLRIYKPSLLNIVVRVLGY